VNTPLDPVNSDVALQFDTIGDRITLRAWAVDQPDDVYSVTWKDEQGPRPLGYMGLGVGGGGPDAVNGQVMVRSFQVSRVQPIFLEDFEDGNASDGNPVTWLAIDATGTVSDGSYVLTTNGTGGVEADEFDSIGDVSLRATVRGLTKGSGDYLNLFSHRQPDGRSHWVLVTPWGLSTGSGLPGRAGIIDTLVQVGAFKPFTGDINIQFDVKGSELSLTVWQPGKAKPSRPQLTSTAPSLPPGRVGFATDYREIAIRSFDAIEIISPPLARWRLDEVQGNIAHDSAGTKDAVVKGEALWQPEGGIFDGALQCDGIDDYIEAPFVLDPANGPFSVFAWIKGGQPGQTILSQAGASDWLLTDAQGCIATSLVSEVGKPGKPLASATIVTDDQWHGVGLVWDGEFRNLYVDGELVAADVEVQDKFPGNQGGLHIGAAGTLDAGTFWSGMIDDVRIDDRVVEAYFPYQYFEDNFVSPKPSLFYDPYEDQASISMEKGLMTIRNTILGGPGIVSVAKKEPGNSIVATDTSMEVVIRLQNPSSQLGMWTRDGVYVCNLNANGRLRMAVLRFEFDGEKWNFNYETVAEIPTELSPLDNDVVVVFDTISTGMSTTIEAQAWEAKSPDVVYSTGEYTNTTPREPQPGNLGLAARNNSEDDLDLAAVDFYSFKLKIFPPTSNSGH
jgi:hypothetical protein